MAEKRERPLRESTCNMSSPATPPPTGLQYGYVANSGACAGSAPASHPAAAPSSSGSEDDDDDDDEEDEDEEAGLLEVYVTPSQKTLIHTHPFFPPVSLTLHSSSIFF